MDGKGRMHSYIVLSHESFVLPYLCGTMVCKVSLGLLGVVILHLAFAWHMMKWTNCFGELRVECLCIMIFRYVCMCVYILL